jgi:hypothetical protein
MAHATVSPLLKGANEPIPSWGFITETVQFQGIMFTSSFLQAAVAGLILGIDFLRRFKITVVPETSQILFACTAAALPARSFLPTFAQFPAAPPTLPGPQDTSPSPKLPVRVSKVNTSNSSSKGHQSMLDPPLWTCSEDSG